MAKTKQKKMEIVESRNEEMGADITSPAPKMAQVKPGVSPARKKLNAIVERKRAARGSK